MLPNDLPPELRPHALELNEGALADLSRAEMTNILELQRLDAGFRLQLARLSASLENGTTQNRQWTEESIARVKRSIASYFPTLAPYLEIYKFKRN